MLLGLLAPEREKHSLPITSVSVFAAALASRAISLVSLLARTRRTRRGETLLSIKSSLGLIKEQKVAGNLRKRDGKKGESN